ncbi:hypothetical protein [Paenibacillus cymbidii]|uniref:hypothetical protein n=1 Tax=Paenibacillus cymbidii TaxID=1639034 RepID=UPI0010812919|nr:hypothetical protein [Paenibacillus cymbidii]
MSEQLLHLIVDKLSTLETCMDEMTVRMDGMATKDDIAKLDAKFDTKFDILSAGLARVEKKLDVTFEQVVRNSAFTPSLHHKPATVEDNALDIRLLKKLLTR